MKVNGKILDIQKGENDQVLNVKVLGGSEYKVVLNKGVYFVIASKNGKFISPIGDGETLTEVIEIISKHNN